MSKPHQDITVVCSCWQQCTLKWNPNLMSFSGTEKGRYYATKSGWTFNPKTGQWTCGMAGHKQLK